MRVRRRAVFVLHRVVDGDTLDGWIECETCGGMERVRIRLAAIDAPEMDMSGALAQVARGRLIELIGATRVLHVSHVKAHPDLYGRHICRVYLAELDLSAEMLRLGAAAPYQEREPRPGPFDPTTAARLRWRSPDGGDVVT